MSCFVDATHCVNKMERRSQTVILIFLNGEPIYWYSKQQASVEDATFGAGCGLLWWELK